MMVQRSYQSPRCQSPVHHQTDNDDQHDEEADEGVGMAREEEDVEVVRLEVELLHGAQGVSFCGHGQD